MRKFYRNQPLHQRSSDLNAMIDAALAHKRGRNRQRVDRKQLVKQAAIFKVRNDSGADRGFLEVVGLDGPVHGPSGTGANLEEFKRRVAFKGVQPTADHAGKFAIYLEPTPDGAFGDALIQGVVPVQVDITNSSHRYAQAKDGACDELVSADNGAAQILWQQSTSPGMRWCVVRLSNEPTEPIAMAKISGGIVRRASGVCTSATATIWEIDGSNTLAATSETQTVYNPSALPIIAGDLVLIKRTRNRKWIVSELMGAMRNFAYHAKIASSTLGSGNAIPTFTLTGGTTWAGTTAFPVSYNSGTSTTLINMPGTYRLTAILYIESKWTQPDDDTHHWARLQFQPYLGGSVHAAALGYANFVFPAKRTSSDNNHNHSGEVSTELAHHHTHSAIGGVYVPVVLSGIVTKTGTTSQAIDIRPTAITTSTSGPAIADFGCATGSIDLQPVGYGDPLGAWPT